MLEYLLPTVHLDCRLSEEVGTRLVESGIQQPVIDTETPNPIFSLSQGQLGSSRHLPSALSVLSAVTLTLASRFLPLFLGHANRGGDYVSVCLL